MTKDEAEKRAQWGLPIESAHELVHALNAVRRRLRERSQLWYLVNRFTRDVLKLADKEPAECKSPNLATPSSIYAKTRPR